ncbi:pancreatic progenitor cell differentiation and proliferation factor-like isoform X1 [Psammomys obesus]|uniref:pancreatic progenitor cell differentiation and proliferation factor-like isoform X1 n=1 Tax=Psammomys obesus TaxID=48139 RepID=UPI002453733B|nr:pancreatic progenitor cell differentiation and proliferation factor-like isoform X1 [Psammomys obesus]
MASIPSSGSLMATHDYYWQRLSSSYSNSSCRNAEYPGDAVPQSPGLPKADSGHWWASFFFGKPTLPLMATVLESPEHLAESSQIPKSLITHDQAPETMKKQPVIHPGQTNTRAQS